MNRRGISCKQCRRWSPDGCDYIVLDGEHGHYGRSTYLCNWNCVAQYALQRGPRNCSRRAPTGLREQEVGR